MLRGGIKFAVATRAEELKKFSDVRLDSKEGKSTVKHLYQYMRGGSSLLEIPYGTSYESVD